jgi:hypothetical protein
MVSLLERLEVREQAARTRVEALRAEMDRLGEQVAAEQELLRRLEITRQTVIEVLAGGDDDGEVGVVVDPKASVGASAPGVGGQVPVFGQDGDGRGLPVAYRDVMEVLADAGPLRARQVCQAVGTGVESRHREGMRIKPRAAGRAWLAGGDRAGAVRLCWRGGCGAERQLTVAGVVKMKVRGSSS